MIRRFGAKFVHPKLISEKQMKNLCEVKLGWHCLQLLFYAQIFLLFDATIFL
jgi:hypothetical protein